MKRSSKLLALSVLASTALLSLSNTTYAATRYTLNNNVKVYKSALDARKGIKAAKTYTKGTYYIYKTSSGMYNITKKAGSPGAWINPKDNKAVKPVVKAVKKTATKTTKTASSKAATQVLKKGAKYTLYNKVKVYRSAKDAKLNKNYTKYYPAKNYYIYRVYDGMINISTAKNAPGGWINPKDNKAPKAKIASTKAAPKKTATTSTKTAAKTTATKIIVPATKLTNYKPAVSITVLDKNPTKLLAKPYSKGAKLYLKTSTKTYLTAYNAKNKVSARGSYSAGIYYIYSVNNNGMINISSVKGKVGSWINPSTTGLYEVTVKEIIKKIPIAKGIDISKWNGYDIDWKKVKASGVDFVMLRVGHGFNASRTQAELDPYFDHFYAGAKAAGLKIGVYFYSQARSASDAIFEANATLKKLNKRHLDLPVTIDIEETYQINMTKSALSNIATAFCNTIAKSGYTPMIYASSSHLLYEFNDQVTSKYPLWVADWKASNSFSKDYQIWQHSATGRVDGIKGAVDLDYLYYYN